MSVEIHKDTLLSHAKLHTKPVPYLDIMVFDSLLDLKMEIPLCGYLGEVFFWSRPDPANLVTLHASALGVERLATLRLSGRSRLVGTKDVKRISGFEDLVRAIHHPSRQLNMMQSANIHMFSIQGEIFKATTPITS